jgi:hypothetical protein
MIPLAYIRDWNSVVPWQDPDMVEQCYKKYMDFSPGKPPTKKQYLTNIEEKMKDDDFLGDTKALIRPEEKYNPSQAWEIVRLELLELL